MDNKDKRNFKRYKKEAELILKANTGAYKGRVIDYSDGICAVVKNASSIVSGTTVNIKSHELGIEFLGEVVWAKKVVPDLHIGIRRVDNLRGSLKDFRLPDILKGLQKTTSTGTLEIHNDSIQKKIYIKNGDLIFASSNQPKESLAKALLTVGKITVDQFKKTVEISEQTGKNQSTTLAELGYLSPQEFVRALKNQVEMIILSSFNVTDATFEFQEGPLDADESIPLRINATNLLYHGYKKVNDLLYLKEECPPLDIELSLSMDPEELVQNLSMSDTDRRILSYLDGKHTIKEILSLAQTSDMETFKTIHALLNIGAIELTEGSVPSAKGLEINNELMEKIEDMNNNYKTLGYYGILGTNEGVSEEEIREAYYRVAKEFHPDRFFSLPSDDIKEKINRIFSYATEAYETLSNEAKRREYDSSLPVKSAKPPSKAEMAKARFNQGRTLLMMRNYSDAATLFAQAIYFDNSTASYHYYHGLALSKLSRFKEAAKTFNEAVKLNPRKADYVAELGHVFLMLGFKARAQNSFKRALELSPSNERALEGIPKTEKSKKSIFGSSENILLRISQKYGLKKKK
ncbi:MAG TPA: DUF4388 domain-containing protein [Nitrospirae bacterium]|nr:DUF4388 domain-containing protein [Nitrospirota bacterium]